MSTNSDGDPIRLNYTSKSINQFYGVDGTIFTIDEGTSIRTDDYAYSYVGIGSTNLVRVRVGSALRDFIQEDETYLCEEGDLIRVKSIGNQPQTEKSRQWFSNLKTTLNRGHHLWY